MPKIFQCLSLSLKDLRAPTLLQFTHATLRAGTETEETGYTKESVVMAGRGTDLPGPTLHVLHKHRYVLMLI